MIEYFKETLKGLAVMLLCWVLFILYMHFTQLCDEDSKRGELARKISKFASGVFFTYLAVSSIAGLIIGIIFLFVKVIL